MQAGKQYSAIVCAAVLKPARQFAFPVIAASAMAGMAAVAAEMDPSRVPGAAGMHSLSNQSLIAAGALIAVLIVLLLVPLLVQIKRLTIALRDRNARLLLAVGAAGMIEWEWDAQTGRTRWGGESEWLFGPRMTGTRHYPDDLREMVHPDDRERFVVAVHKTIDEGVPYDIEFRLVRTDGEVHWLRQLGTPAPVAAGRALRVVGVVQDVTERRRAEDALASMRALIARKDEELGAVNRELDAFAYSVSHDMRAPLRHIDGFAALLREHAAGSLGQEGTQFLERISNAAQRMGRMFDGLVAFSRMSRTELHNTVVDLDRLVADVIADARAQNPDRNIDWRAAPLPKVFGDAALLQIAFANLIGNAVKYTGKRERAVIEIATAESTSGQVVVCVRDNGVGFDMQYSHKLFGVFQRLHREDEFEGTGMGLAIVQRIVARHGGRVWAEARLGEGASFYVTIPRAGK